MSASDGILSDLARRGLDDLNRTAERVGALEGELCRLRMEVLEVRDQLDRAGSAATTYADVGELVDAHLRIRDGLGTLLAALTEVGDTDEWRCRVEDGEYSPGDLGHRAADRLRDLASVTPDNLLGRDECEALEKVLRSFGRGSGARSTPLTQRVTRALQAAHSVIQDQQTKIAEMGAQLQAARDLARRAAGTDGDDT